MSDDQTFGMSVPERSWAAESYHFGLNGKENDGEWDAQDYGMRMYQPKMCRFVSPDPLIVFGQEYAELSSYQFASNHPINGFDLKGLEWSVSVSEATNEKDGVTKSITFLSIRQSLTK